MHIGYFAPKGAGIRVGVSIHLIVNHMYIITTFREIELMNTRRTGGRKTWHRLQDWDIAQADSERLNLAIYTGSAVFRIA
jgi:hypothetical protein